MATLSRLARSTIGLKIAMAASGAALILFLIGHIAGNLLIFQGPDAFNGYAEGLHGLPRLLWAARIGLLAMLVVHVASAIRLNRLNAAARPQAYAQRTWLRTGLSARTMVQSGLLVLAFIIYHLLHFTLGVVQPEHFAGHGGAHAHDVYYMVVAGFSSAPIALSYLVAVALLAMHLYHATKSAFQTLGLRSPRSARTVDRFGAAFAIVVALAYASIPLSILAGLVPVSGG